ncbi:MAG: hypothetical protein WC238_01340 [Parcubacteria group bacterium]|jgi:hypothetical protein
MGKLGISFYTDRGYYNRKAAKDPAFRNMLLTSGNRRLRIFSANPHLAQDYLHGSLPEISRKAQTGLAAKHLFGAKN